MRAIYQFIAAATVLNILFASSVDAQSVNSEAFGDQLRGGTITVVFQSGAAIHAAMIAGSVPNQGLAGSPGFFEFSVTGDTGISTWLLRNLTRNDFIRTVVLDLSGSIALFDNDGPDTPDSFAGRQGVVRVRGPVPLAGFEFARWTDPRNQGDMFLAEKIIFSSDSFGPGATFEWLDDTDLSTSIAIPTLNIWGIMIMGLVFLWAISIVYSRRSRLE
jgi:hypothetical protein